MATCFTCRKREDMKQERIKVQLYNKTYKEIDMSDFSEIPEELFSNRSDIVSVWLPDGVKKIDANAFENCFRLSEIFFPNTLRVIGNEAFRNCVNLKKPEISEKVDVSETAFVGCNL